MGTRQSFYLESLGESSTTSASEQVKTTLTFTPDANSDYWLIASGAFTCSSTIDNHQGQVDLWHNEASTALFYQAGQVKEPSSPQDWIAFFGIAKLSFGTAPGSQQLDVNINPRFSSWLAATWVGSAGSQSQIVVSSGR